MPTVGLEFQTEFRFGSKDVADFAAVTGDTNPIHLDAEFAATTRFKKTILHGMLSASIFSKVFGTEYPGSGTVYVGQTLEFKRPMYPDEPYIATFKITNCDAVSGVIVIECLVKDSQSKVCLSGTATLMNKGIFENLG